MLPAYGSIMDWGSKWLRPWRVGYRAYLGESTVDFMIELVEIRRSGIPWR